MTVFYMCKKEIKHETQHAVARTAHTRTKGGYITRRISTQKTHSNRSTNIYLGKTVLSPYNCLGHKPLGSLFDL